MARGRGRLPGAYGYPLRGYGPLVVLTATLVTMMAVLPSTVSGGPASSGSPPAQGAVGETATGWGRTVVPCEDRAVQAEGLSYSPPCFSFTGDDGGPTARGVTGDTVRVSYRMTADPNLLVLMGQVGGVPFDDSNDEILRTTQAFVDYVNANFQFYGRRIELVPYDGRGLMLPEAGGAGQDAATNDALRAADDVGAFADLSGLTPVYADALARAGVVSLGAPNMSGPWFEERRPFAWSVFSDCSASADVSAAYADRRVLGRPAEHAGGQLRGRSRRLAVFYPDNVEYERCVDRYEDGLDEAGWELDLRLSYSLDSAQAQGQAAGLVARAASEGVTTVSCACDAVMALYLAQEAAALGYEPEWLVSGSFLTLDLSGQVIARNAPEQWARAFGWSPWGTPQGAATSQARAAYRSVRDDEPAALVELIFHNVLLLALGIQMAGPDLTPRSFEAGLFALPPAEGQAGLWDFGPGRYTPVQDVREVWWDPEARSPFNGRPGTYRDDGRRFTPEALPAGPPEVFG